MIKKIEFGFELFFTVFAIPFFIIGYTVGTIIGALWVGFRDAWKQVDWK